MQFLITRGVAARANKCGTCKLAAIGRWTDERIGRVLDASGKAAPRLSTPRRAQTLRVLLSTRKP